MKNFADKIEHFVAVSPYSASGLGMTVVNDRNFVFALRTGKSPRLVTAEKFERFMIDWYKQNPASAPDGLLESVGS